MHSTATIFTAICLASVLLTGCAGSAKTADSSAAIAAEVPRSYGAIESIRTADRTAPLHQNLGPPTWIPAWQPVQTSKHHILVRLDDGNAKNVTQESIHELGVGNRVSVFNNRVYRY